VSEEEMKAYQKVSALMGGGASSFGGASVAAGCILDCIGGCINECAIRACTIVRNPIRACTVVRNCTIVRQCTWECYECGGGCAPGGGGFAGGGFSSLGG